MQCVQGLDVAPMSPKAEPLGFVLELAVAHPLDQPYLYVLLQEERPVFPSGQPERLPQPDGGALGRREEQRHRGPGQGQRWGHGLQDQLCEYAGTHAPTHAPTHAQFTTSYFFIIIYNENC